MKDFTYEEKDRKDKFEKYEWDNLWLDHADDLSLNRVLYIGDSISCRAGRAATAFAQEKILFDGFGTSKGIDNPYFKESVKLFAKEEERRDVVIFNNGLHGWHLEDNTEYRYHYEEMIKFLLSEFENTPLVIVLTTITADEKRNKRIQTRNKVAEEIADKYRLPVIDLYTAGSAELLSDDGVHFKPEGDKVLAEKIVESVVKYIPDAKL